METIESLIRELETSVLHPELRQRCKEALTEGSATALALEGRRRRLRRRQQELAASALVAPGSSEELARLARSEHELASEERSLRDLLSRLREREIAATRRQRAHPGQVQPAS